MKDLGFDYKMYKAGMFFDKHDDVANVRDRQKYCIEKFELDKRQSDAFLHLHSSKHGRRSRC